MSGRGCSLFQPSITGDLCLMLGSGLGSAVLVNSDSGQAFAAIYKVRDLLFDQGQLLLGNVPTTPPSTLPPAPSGGGGQVSLPFLLLLFVFALTRVQAGGIVIGRNLCSVTIRLA